MQVSFSAYLTNLKTPQFGVRGKRYEIGTNDNLPLVKINDSTIPKLHYMGKGVFRSAAPDYEKQDVLKLLRDLRIGYVIDLRETYSPKSLSLPKPTPSDKDMMLTRQGFDGSAGGVTTGKNLIEFTPQLNAILKGLNRRTRLLVHCDRGESRTGLVAALIRKIRKQGSNADIITEGTRLGTPNSEMAIQAMLMFYDTVKLDPK